MTTREANEDDVGFKSLENEGNINIMLTTRSLSIQEATDFVRTDKGGAIILFGGTTRDTFDGKAVKLLCYEAHKKLAIRTLSRVAKEAQHKFSKSIKDEFIHRIYICHRLGEVPIGEESVLVALSSTHRNEGWNAAIWILDQIKERAEVWKLERYDDGGSSWKQNKDATNN